MDNKDLMRILQRIKDAESFVDRWRANIVRWRKLYDGQHYDRPARSEEVRYNDPTYQNTVDLAVGIMLANELEWHVSGDPSAEEESLSTEVEKYLAACWSVNNEREEASLMYEVLMNFARDGGAVIYSVWDRVIAESALGTKEFPKEDSEEGVEAKYAFNEIPMRIKVIDPLSVFLLPGGAKRWMVAGRHEDRTVLDVEMSYGVNLPGFEAYDEAQKAITIGKFVDYWEYHIDGGKTVVRNCCLFNSKPIPGWELRNMDGYTDLPYTVQFYKPTSRTNSDKWYSILTPLIESVGLLERSVNRRQRQIDVYSALPIVTKTHLGKAVSIEGFGNTVGLGTDEDIGFPTWPGNAPDVQLQIDLYRSRIQQSGFSDVMFGSGQSQIAGYALSQLGDQNRIRLEQPAEHLELLFTSWARKALRMTAYFSKNAKILIFGSTSGVDFIDWFEMGESEYVVKAKVRPKFPNEEVRRHAMATQARGVLSEYTLMQKYYDIQQPDEEIERRNIELAMKHPVVMNYMMMLQLKKRADEGDEVAAMALQALQNGGLQGTPGRPNEPNNPEQPLGLQSPTGSATPTAGPQDLNSQMENMAGASPTMGGAISNG